MLGITVVQPHTWLIFISRWRSVQVILEGNHSRQRYCVRETPRHPRATAPALPGLVLLLCSLVLPCLRTHFDAPISRCHSCCCFCQVPLPTIPCSIPKFCFCQGQSLEGQPPGSPDKSRGMSVSKSRGMLSSDPTPPPPPRCGTCMLFLIHIKNKFIFLKEGSQILVGFLFIFL